VEKETNLVSNGISLPVVEEFFSLQGEGFHTGKAAYFIRLGGCDIGCSWCDSRFAWDPDLHPVVESKAIVKRVVQSGADSVVVTGGEPLMWSLDFLCQELKNNNINTYIETSGAYPMSGDWDWICLSPKRNMPPIVEICKVANELKVIVQDSSDFEWAERYLGMVNSECLLYLQPEWSRFEFVVPGIVEYIKKNPIWRISLQVHKYLHIP
jgi:organic radical activating enzyme